MWIYVPREYAAIEAGRDQQTFFRWIFNVFHPIQMAMQTSDFRFQITCIPYGHRWIIRARSKHLICEKSAKENSISQRAS